jgi:hypothetical protein
MDCIGPKQMFPLDSETTLRLETFIYCAFGLFFSLIISMMAVLSVALYRTLRNCVPRAEKRIK